MPTRLAVIITALPLEREAVQQHLRDVSIEPEHRGSIYRRGVFDERSEPWDVVVAEIGAGNANAAAEAVRIIDHYSPQVALFVGIAGALKDVTHGDVVASTKVYEYESGKDEADFKARPSVQLSDYRLEKRAQYEASEPEWQKRIKGVLPAEANEPKARVAPIAAGEKVVGSHLSQTYKLIRQHYGDAVAVEMEGHGFLLGVRMNHGTQGIVVRGISDLVDDKDETNDKKWQPVAARHAAAFAFEILAKQPLSEDLKSHAAAATAPVQQVTFGDVSGNNNTFNVQQHHGATIEDIAKLIRTTAPDANAEIDMACARMNAGDLTIAIHILEDLRKKRWDGLSPREKYRVEANTGHALERKGEFKKAAHHYMEAKRHQPHDENARALESIAYYHLDNKAKAYELAGELLKQHPNCSIAIAIRIRSSPPYVKMEELEASVPAALGEEPEILHALGWKALTQGDLAAANRFVEISLKLNPDSVEVKEQQAIVIVQEEGKAKHASKQVNMARLEIAIANLTAGVDKHRGHRDEARLRYNRAEAYDLVGQAEDAETDFRTAFDANKEDADVARRFVLFLKRHDRTHAAINVLLQADKVKKDHHNRLILSSLVSERKQNDDVEYAISLLQETLAQKPDLDIRTEMVALLIHLLGGRNQYDKAISYLDGLDSTFLEPAVLNAIRSRAFLRAGRIDEATNYAIRGAEGLTANSSITDRMRVAESLSLVGKKQEALKQWKEILKPDHVDPFVRIALQLARETGDDTYIMSFCKQLRADGAMSPFTLELEVETLEKYRVFETAIKVMNGYLAATPDGELAKVFRLRLSLLGIRLDKPELVESNPANLPAVETAPVNIGAATAHVLRSGPHPKLGIEYAYELVRRNFNDHTSRGAYVGILGIGDDEHHFPEVSTVGPGCAVKYKADDTGEEKWLIVEDAANPDQEREEYGPDHIWVSEMTGQSAGGKFHLRRDHLQPRTATIIGIINKYVYRKYEIINGWEERFPDEDKFFVRKYTFPTNPDGSPDISLILKQLDLREKQVEEMHALYRDNPISATTFARFTDVGLLESLSHIASEGTLPIRCCHGNEAELAQAETAISYTEKLILDPSALATLFFSNQYEQLQLLAGRIVLCESALDEYTELRRKSTSPSRGFMGKFKGKYLFREDDPTERERQEQRLEKFLTKIKPLVTMRTGESLAQLTPEAREELIRLFGEPTAQAMAEAAATGAVLWTDDLAVAEFGRERTGITKRVWTQLVFRSLAPADVQHELALFLLEWRYFFTRIEPEVVLAACRAASWDADAPVIKHVADWLNKPELLNNGAVQVCAQSLRLLWKHGPDLEHKQAVARLLLQAVRRRKDGRRAIAFILNNLGKIFEVDEAARSECASVIYEVQNAEMTPGEIASSKTAWSNVLRQMKRRMGLASQETPVHSSRHNEELTRKGKKRSDRGKRLINNRKRKKR